MALAGIGAMNVVCLLAGFGLGWWVDRRLRTTPAFILVGSVLGIAAGAFGTYQEVRKYLRD